MSINSTSGTNYMSNASIMEWMELKTERLYGQMSSAMDASNSRVDAEDALNEVKAKIAELKASGGDASQLRTQIEETIAKYGNEFPEVAQALQPIADELSKKIEDTQLKTVNKNTASNSSPGTRSGGTRTPTPAPTPAKGEAVESTHSDAKVELPHAKVSSDDAERWTNSIKDKVDALGKQDQLGMVHLQDLNGQLNRAKDVASALMASADKAADNIVSHIS